MLLGIEEIGVQIEVCTSSFARLAAVHSAKAILCVPTQEPFAILPLQPLCEIIKLDVADALRDSPMIVQKA